MEPIINAREPKNIFITIVQSSKSYLYYTFIIRRTCTILRIHFTCTGKHFYRILECVTQTVLN